MEIQRWSRDPDASSAHLRSNQRVPDEDKHIVDGRDRICFRSSLLLEEPTSPLGHRHGEKERSSLCVKLDPQLGFSDTSVIKWNPRSEKIISETRASNSEVAPQLFQHVTSPENTGFPQ